MQQAISAFGLLVMIAIAWLLSSHRKHVPWRIVAGGLALQFLLAILALRTQGGRWFFESINSLVSHLVGFVREGSLFVFRMHGLPPDQQSMAESLVGSFAFGVLPTIIFFSSLMAILYHLGWMQWVVRQLAWGMQKTLRTSGPETLSAAANIFVGHTEAPLVIKPYIERMTRSELHAMMTAGFATVTGSMLAAYAGFGIDAGHLLTACIISAPAALLISKVMEPELHPEQTEQSLKLDLPRTSPNLIGAAADGASEGLKLALNVGAMLIAFLALIAMADWMLGQFGKALGAVTTDGKPLWSLPTALGYVFAPIAWVMGIAAEDCLAAGKLLGIKMVANEFIAYQQLGEQIQQQMVSERTRTIMTYALAGFSNFGAIGIQVGGIGALAPGRKDDIARLGLRAMIAGTLACNMTACVAGMLSD
ncbi:MAG: NupC/NupG family nucleoside CNT transporter [Pirellulaceae bacterium]|jgi:CNT family concentrative nucleoside transporter